MSLVTPGSSKRGTYWFFVHWFGAVFSQSMIDRLVCGCMQRRLTVVSDPHRDNAVRAADSTHRREVRRNGFFAVFVLGRHERKDDLITVNAKVLEGTRGCSMATMLALWNGYGS